jgi:uncharacterized protein (TIGR03086 family)
MELLDAHGKALAGFDWVVGEIGFGDWSSPTPCSAWDVRALLNHLVYEQLWVPDLLDGATVAEVGDRYDGDVLGDDPTGRWRETSSAAREAWLAPGVLSREVDLSFGRVPATEYGWQLTMDLAVHGWDLARGIGASSPLDDAMASLLYQRFADQIGLWGGDYFAPPIPVGPDADPVTRLLAALGRSPDWTGQRR